jgi:hypothetical protein
VRTFSSVHCIQWGGVRVAGLRGTLRGAGSGFFLSVISFSRVSSRSRRSVFLPPRPRHTDNRHRQTRPTSSCGSIAVILASPPASGSAHAARTFLRSRNPTGDGPSRTSLGASARGAAGGGARGPRRGARRRVFLDARPHVNTVKTAINKKYTYASNRSMPSPRRHSPEPAIEEGARDTPCPCRSCRGWPCFR